MQKINFSYNIQQKEENIEKKKDGANQKAAALRGRKNEVAVKDDGAKKEEEQKQAEKKEILEVNEINKRKNPDDLNDWDFLYGSFELFTENRKRNQIILVNNVIFNIKRAFNKEFEDMVKKRQTFVRNKI